YDTISLAAAPGARPGRRRKARRYGHAGRRRQGRKGVPLPRAGQAGAMELGIYSFVENTPIAPTGKTLSPEERMRNLLEEIRLAEDRKSTRLNSSHVKISY